MAGKMPLVFLPASQVPMVTALTEGLKLMLSVDMTFIHSFGRINYLVSMTSVSVIELGIGQRDRRKDTLVSDRDYL
jgi:hypothetical protein